MFSNVGDWYGSFCGQMDELFVYHFSRDNNVSKKKAVLTNCMIKKDKTPRDRRYTILAHEEYNLIFNLCDIFNRSWQLRFGGHGVYTEPPTEHNFAFSSIPENIFSLYMYMNSI
jgi:hypothetical protein